MGVHARMMSQSLKKLSPVVAKKNAVVVFINQTRMRIGVMFGNPETVTGGNALKFYATVRLRTSISIAKDTSIRGASDTLTGKKEKERLGSSMTVKCIKNKIFRPFLQTEMSLYYGLGVSRLDDMYDFA